MFSVNDYIIYGSEGVCRVEEIGHPQISGLDHSKQYYTLVPAFRNGKIYTPVDSPVVMRCVINSEEAKALVARIPEITFDLEVPADFKLANAFYRDIIRSYECEKLVSVIKYIGNKQKQLALIKKNLSALESRILKTAEDMLYSELGFALEISHSDVKKYIAEICEGK